MQYGQKRRPPEAKERRVHELAGGSAASDESVPGAAAAERPDEGAVPASQLVSEDPEIQPDDPEQDSEDNSEVPDDDAILVEVQKSLVQQGFSAEVGRSVVTLKVPAGRSTRDVVITANTAPLALAQDLKGWRSLARFDGVWHQQQGIVEVAIQGERFTMSLERALGLGNIRTEMGGEPATRQYSDEGTGATVEFARASDLFTVLTNTSRYNVRRRLVLRIFPLVLGGVEEADDVVESVTDSLSFQLSVQLGTLFVAQRLQDRRLIGPRRRLYRGETSFPRNFYPHAPIVLYQTGRDRMTSPLLRYWAFYQVLEYFFPKYTRADYLQHLTRVLRDPTFSAHDEGAVMRVASLALDGGGARANEEQQLTICLRAIITEGELREFIEESDMTQILKERGGGVSTRVIKVDGDDLVGQVARRIYDIRCKIVHSKSSSQRDDGAGLLPGTKDDDLVRYELPLVEYLAQQALNASAAPRELRVLGG